MSQVLDLCEDSDDNGEWSNTAASVPSLPLSKKRPRDKEELSNDDHPRNEKGRGHKIAAGSTENELGSEDSEHKSRDDGSPNKHSQKLSTSKSPSNRQTMGLY
jgi:hypothetical protein